MLGHHHRLTHGKAQLAGCLLLQGRRGEGGGRRALHRFLRHRFYLIGGIYTLLQELLHLRVGLQSLGERGPYLRLRTVRIGNRKNTTDAIVRLALESLYLALAFHY